MEEICPNQPQLVKILNAKKWKNTTCSAAKNRNEVRAGRRGRPLSRFIMLEDTQRTKRMFRWTRPSATSWPRPLVLMRLLVVFLSGRGVPLRASPPGCPDRVGDRHRDR